jgi:hypothetical protein
MTSLIGTKSVHRFPCPCCGYLAFSGPPGTHEFCPICGWEDDLSQLRFPGLSGANKISLKVAQKIFVAFGASNSEKAVMSRVRAP